MKFLDINGVSILWRRIKTMFARKNETVSNISRNNTTFTATRADGTTFTFDQKDTTYNNATTTTAGLMSATDKAKLNSIENGAQENVVESVSVNGTKQAITNKGINITVPTAVSDLNNDLGYLTYESDPTVPSWAKQAQKPAYTASEVGALPADTFIPTKVSDLTDDSGHYTKPNGGIPSTDLSSDILTTLEKADTVVQDVSDAQDAIAILTEKLNALADSDDTTLDQMSEIVAYIKNNKSLIDGITTGKISVTDIVDNLTSNAANKPLSAKQGKVLKGLIDSIVIPTKTSELTNDSGYLTQHQDISGKANISDLSAVATSGSYNDLSNKPTIPSKTSDLTNDSGFITNATVPTATTSKSGTTTTLTVTDKNGTTTSQILDGAQGQQGPKGDTGDSGVYVGNTEPTGDENVWINPSGTPDIDPQDIADLQDDVNGKLVEDMLLRSEIPGTVQTVTFDANNNPSTIVHSASGATVRTDTFTWGTNTVTEVRTLSSGKSITITTNLTTLEQTISAITEVV